MRIQLTAIILFLHFSTTAQKVIDVEKNDNIGSNTFYSVGGEPFISAKFVRLQSGTPYFSDAWMKAKGTTANGLVYSTPKLKINLLDNQLIFLDARGAEMISSVALKELLLTDTVTGKEYHFIHSGLFPAASQAKAGWYLQLSFGKASLYQFFNKRLVENKPYGSATTEQSIITTEELFIHVNGKFFPVRELKEVPLILNDSKKELEQYAGMKELQKNATLDQFIMLVDYYNSLQ